MQKSVRIASSVLITALVIKEQQQNPVLTQELAQRHEELIFCHGIRENKEVTDHYSGGVPGCWVSVIYVCYHGFGCDCAGCFMAGPAEHQVPIRN